MCHFQAKSALTYFQTPTHEISLFASLNTLNDFFLYKTKKKTIMSLSGQFQLFLTLQSDCSPLASTCLTPWPIFWKNVWSSADDEEVIFVTS